MLDWAISGDSLISAIKMEGVSSSLCLSDAYEVVFEPGHEKMCLIPYANNKGADQPAHPRSLISAFVVRCQNRMIPLVYISEISRF